MSNLWIIFAITVLIAVYSGIQIFTNLNNSFFSFKYQTTVSFNINFKTLTII